MCDLEIDVQRKVVQRAHSTPDPDADPPRPSPNPDDVPPPANAPVQEPTMPEPPIKARPAMRL